jgi:uncharacterized protein
LRKSSNAGCIRIEAKNTPLKNIMSLEQIVMADLKVAMRTKDGKALRSLRAVKAAIILAKTAEGAGGEISPEEEAKILQKLVKQRKDSLEIYQQQNRADLAQKEQEEIEIIEKFLPQQLSADALKDALAKIIADTGASSVADMGKVMGVATKQLAGQADGKAINAMARELLTK